MCDVMNKFELEVTPRSVTCVVHTNASSRRCVSDRGRSTILSSLRSRFITLQLLKSVDEPFTLTKKPTLILLHTSERTRAND